MKVRFLFVVLLLTYFSKFSCLQAQSLLNEKESKKKAKEVLKLYKSGKLASTLALIYSERQKINARKLTGGIKDKYIQCKKSLKKYKSTHLDFILQLERYEQALKEGSIYRSAGILYADIDTSFVFTESRAKWSSLKKEVEKLAGEKLKTDLMDAKSSFRSEFIGTCIDSAAWTGSVDNCNPGSIPLSIQKLALKRVNYFRKMSGVPLIPDSGIDSARCAESQAAALIMAANRRLSHGPDTSWKCYSKVGAKAARTNLQFCNSRYFISNFIQDGGSHNKRVGHRTTHLRPYADKYRVGIADVNGTFFVSSSCYFDHWYRPDHLKDKDFNYPYPAQGFIPSPVLYNRWSYSTTLRDRIFEKATVEIFDANGKKYTCPIEYVRNGHLVWYIQNWSRYTNKERWYLVRISGLKPAENGAQIEETIEYGVIEFPEVYKSYGKN